MENPTQYRGKHGGRKRVLDEEAASTSAKASRKQCMKNLRQKQKRELHEQRRLERLGLEESGSEDQDGADNVYADDEVHDADQVHDADENMFEADENVLEDYDNMLDDENEFQDDENELQDDENELQDDENELQDEENELQDEENVDHDADEDDAVEGGVGGDGHDQGGDEDGFSDAPPDNDGEEDRSTSSSDAEDFFNKDGVIPMPSGPVPFSQKVVPPRDQWRNEFLCAVAGAKVRSQTSDAGFSHIFSVFMTRLRIILALRENGEIGTSYRHSIKPALLRGMPRFSYTTVVHNETVTPPIIEVTEELAAIPQELLLLPARCKRTLVRQEGHVRLSDVKLFHRAVLRSQGLSTAQWKEDCQSLTISVDGVAESKHAKRTMKLVTCRFGKLAIYVISVHSYLLKREFAKPTPAELLEYVIIIQNYSEASYDR